ncbi:MAG: BMC domain-containing protein [Alkalispirochaeta sp.]|jgi:microcompartment protein CcmL/EutN
MRNDDIEILGMIEFSDTASAVSALDTMVKAAPIEVLRILQVNPGKTVLFIGGDVASVELALQAGERVGDGKPVDQGSSSSTLIGTTFLPNVHPSVSAALRGRSVDSRDVSSLGVVDGSSITGIVFAADAAAKDADVVVMELRMGDSMGGRASMRLTGELYELESAMEVAKSYLVERGQLISAVVIANPHDDVLTTLENWSGINNDR